MKEYLLTIGDKTYPFLNSMPNYYVLSTTDLTITAHALEPEIVLEARDKEKDKGHWQISCEVKIESIGIRVNYQHVKNLNLLEALEKAVLYALDIMEYQKKQIEKHLERLNAFVPTQKGKATLEAREFDPKQQ